MNDILVDDIVQFSTGCFWDGCSGKVTKVGEYINVELPGGMRMAFNRSEIEVKFRDNKRVR
jgi:hypothetical protein